MGQDSKKRTAILKKLFYGKGTAFWLAAYIVFVLFARENRCGRKEMRRPSHLTYITPGWLLWREGRVG